MTNISDVLEITPFEILTGDRAETCAVHALAVGEPVYPCFPGPVGYLRVRLGEHDIPLCTGHALSLRAIAMLIRAAFPVVPDAEDEPSGTADAQPNQQGDNPGPIWDGSPDP